MRFFDSNWKGGGKDKWIEVRECQVEMVMGRMWRKWENN